MPVMTIWLYDAFFAGDDLLAGCISRKSEQGLFDLRGYLQVPIDLKSEGFIGLCNDLILPGSLFVEGVFSTGRFGRWCYTHDCDEQFLVENDQALYLLVGGELGAIKLFPEFDDRPQVRSRVMWNAEVVHHPH
ncbi:MAG: hypothetical protein A2666_03500 [Parcubacteria group bacterium RIFCSPHIGHO2_01_FULL_47_10b]|nr:MAG: hypothetical protein A2666_03500 [Parcubacteria group bacterium RIFCSPHIGHO2_01_FULL_47_10b]